MTNTASEHATDVVVIGGGPGGSTAATMLARMGVQVLLLERERFPRPHVGESLLPASVPILEELGVRDAVESAGFLKKWGATMVWGSGAEPWSWYFRETSERYPHSYQVSRPEFDQLLLENSRAHGVDVREGHRAVEVCFEDGRAVGVRYATDEDGEGFMRARFVVDASGQSGLIAHALALRRFDSFFRNLAVYSYFEGAARLPEPAETNIFIESHAEGWCWTIPLHNGQSSVGVVLDSESAQGRIDGGAIDRFFHEQIAQAPRTQELLSGARLVSGPFVVRDWSYLSDNVVGEGYVLVGDAACFVDPLFSSGVHLAMSSGVLAAAYITSALRDPELGQAAAPVYQQLYYTQYGHFHELAKLFYSSNRTVDSYFWEARRILGEDEGFSPRQAFIRAVAGQPPRGYERAVLGQGEPPAEFVESVRAVESERIDRRERLARSRGALLDAVPRLAAGVEVSVKPVPGEGEFVWSHVISSSARPEGAPCSPLVAELLGRVDGRRSVRELIDALRTELDAGSGRDLEGGVTVALEILYVDGTVEDLTGA